MTDREIEILTKDASSSVEPMFLKERLRHLLQSDFIRSFDQKNPMTGQYRRDIKEADKIAKQTNNDTKLQIIYDDREPVYAIAKGVVHEIGRMNCCKYGRFVRIVNKNHSYTYCHLDEVTAKEGQKIRKGQAIGYINRGGVI